MTTSLQVFNSNSDVTMCVGKVPDTTEEKIAMANAMGSATNKLSEYINMQINLVNYYLERLSMVDEDTGVVSNPLRVVLVDDQGISYQCVSSGVATSLKSIILMFGPAEQWTAPVPVMVKSTKRGKGSMLSLQCVTGEAK